MARALRVGLLVAALTGATIAATAAPASAHINYISCTYSVGDSTVSARCGHPGPDVHRYRAWAYCTDGRFHTGSWFYLNSGSWSTARCGTNVFVIDYGHDITLP